CIPRPSRKRCGTCIAPGGWWTSSPPPRPAIEGVGVSTLDQITTPSLVLDLDVLDANVDRMARRANDLGVALRPHLTTHKCVEVAERQRALGASGVTVSTLYEARVFADHGFSDIT